ncbi:phosphate/phosphite/phosphonate ABC transporter substrate-binding protein [Phaeospirillum tilakii]|uniref:Phosphate/phosphite/phosphonate ABC transporter substrate-binding protein n=1 Tax=Phaeospirillum tilakii TaxID=741673 RepID=A0ABW5CBZ9_9PROT
MRRREAITGLLGLALAVLTAGPARAEDQPLRIGVVPHTSARFVLELYQPLREHLEQALGRPVEVITAPDFTTFVRRALAQEYDLAITTGHQAQLLRVDAGYLPIRTYAAEFRAVVVVPRDSAASGPEALDGSRVIGLSPTSLVTQWGLHWLNAHHVAADVRYVSAADSVAQLVLAGDAAAGLLSTANFLSLNPDVQARLRFLVRSEPMLGRVYLLNRRLAGQRPAIDAALDTFAASPAGQRYFETTALGGYRAVRPEELSALEPFAREVRAILESQRTP